MPKRSLSQLMTWNIVTVDEGATLARAAEVMETAHISSVLVAAAGKPVGIVTERDILRALQAAVAPEQAVATVMGHPLVIARQTLLVHEAYHLMAEKGVRHLLVADTEDCPVGIVSESDFRFHLGLDFYRRLQDVCTVMSSQMPVLPPNAPLRQAVAAMAAREANCVVVAAGAPLGIVTERDAVRFYRQGSDTLDRPLGEVMSTPVATIPLGTRLHDAMDRMHSQRIRHLVVVGDDGMVAGVLSEHDVVRQLETEYLDFALRENCQTRQRLMENEQRLERLTHYDALSGLPNRSLFRDHLQLAVRKSRRDDQPLALFLIDLDHFKAINDSLGHAVGDQLLVEAARRIASCVRHSDNVARLGGDEFTVILPGLENQETAERVAQEIIEALAAPFLLGRETAYVSASIGITVYPADAEDPESLIKAADQAMYEAKAQGRNGFSFFAGSMQVAARERQRLVNDLHGALQNGQFEVYYQPIVDLASRRIVKAEALLRWHHPEKGLVSPAQFIPVAEETGLINEIGDWVFKEAARAAKRWNESARCGTVGSAAGRGVEPIQIAINKSPRQFLAGNTHEAWLGYLRAINLPPRCVTIEITEGLLLDNRAEILDKLLQFRAAGIEVALDDFGTGYSAMSYLRKFRLDYLKIDQSFVADMAVDAGSRAIVEAIIVMAHKLGLKVVAEGVETVVQRDILDAAGCDYCQGYLFAHPLPARDFEALLAENAGPAW